MLKLLLVLSFCAIALASGEEKARRPKLFFISTSSTTSTLKTLSVCYTTNAALSACGRKKRALILEGGPVEEAEEEMAPTKTQRLEDEIEEDGPKIEGEEIVSSKDDEAERDGKFLLYWKTTTLTSTSTTYTVTHSLKKLECTPSGFNLA